MATVQEDQAWTTDQYLYLFGRPPTEYERNHVVEALQSGRYTRSRWAAEAEGLEAEASVQRLFGEIVGADRAADDPGIQYYAQKLKSGQMTRAQIRAEMSAKTAENRKLQGTTGTPTDDLAGKEDAAALINETLNRYDLGSLSGWAWDQIKAGNSMTRVLQDLRERPEYKTRFAGMDRRRAAGLPAISEGEYIAYERDVRQMMRAAGLPEGFYDQADDFADFIGKDVSLSEMQARINEGYQAAMAAPQEVRDALQRMYGIGLGSIAASFLDPDRALPLVQQQWAASQISGAANRVGYGDLANAEAERLAALNVSEADAQEGFGLLASSLELFNDIAGEQGTSISRNDQISAVFEGNVQGQQRIQNKAQTRVAVGSGAQSFAIGNRGVGGLAEQ